MGVGGDSAGSVELRVVVQLVRYMWDRLRV